MDDARRRPAATAPAPPPEPGAAPGGLPLGGVRPDGSAVIRLLSYNIRSLRDDTAALVRVVRACEPDVVCIQEAPRFARWRQKSRRLASDTGLLWLTGGRPAAGPVLLTSLRPTALWVEDVLLPRSPGLHQRGFAVAGLAVGRARFTVLSCHLSLSGRERYGQAGLLLDRLAGRPHPIAAGDVNERPEGRAWRRIAGRFTDAHAAAPWGGADTSEARTPRQRIDGVFAGAGVRVLGCGVPLGLPGVHPADLRAATDHLPVLAALEIPPGG